MVVRIARILSAGVMAVLLAAAPPAVCAGWSLPNPFSSVGKAETKSKKPVKKEPSALEKIGADTKKFFSHSAETLGLKKPEAKRPHAAYPRTPVVQSQKKEISKSWLPPLFKSEEPKKPKTVSEWLNNKRLDP